MTIEELLRQTMTEFWGTNNMEQKFDVFRRALLKAHDMGEEYAELQARINSK